MADDKSDPSGPRRAGQDEAAAGEPVSPQGGRNATAEALEVLRRLSLRTKALVISSEFTRRQMEPQELRQVLELLAPAAEERSKAVRAVEEELRAARYPVGEIVRLLSALSSEGDGERPPLPQDPNIMNTRKVRSPNLMPFERFEFDAPRRRPDAPSDDKADERVNERADKGADEGRPPDQPAGADAEGESAPFSAKGFAEGHKGLAGMGARFTRRPGGTPGAEAVTSAVLVADDDGRARMMYRSKLEESGFSVVEAKDGVEAWDHIRRGGVHCVVMDMKMPGYHGLEILGRMVDADLLTPVVVVSAFDQLANEFVVATYPKLRFLTKPAPPERVVDAVKSLLRPGRRVET